MEAEPDVARVELSSADEFLLLASDGLWDVLTDQQACDVARQVLQVGHALCGSELVMQVGHALCGSELVMRTVIYI